MIQTREQSEANFIVKSRQRQTGARALVESELPHVAALAGLIDGRVVRRFNCFYDTTTEANVAKNLFIQTVNFLARKEAAGLAKRHGRPY